MARYDIYVFKNEGYIYTGNENELVNVYVEQEARFMKNGFCFQEEDEVEGVVDG